MSEINPNWRGTVIEEIIRRFGLYVHMSPGGWWFERTEATKDAKEGSGHICLDENTPDEEIAVKLREWLGIKEARVIHICAANELARSVRVQPTHIFIDQQLPEPGNDFSLKRCEEMFWEQAQLLVDALYHSLPQGTRWRVIIELMKREQNLYYGVQQIPLDAALLNWLEEKRDTVELRYDDVQLWILEDQNTNQWQGADIREVLTRASMEKAGDYTIAATTKPFNAADYPPDHMPDLWEKVPVHLRDGLRAYLVEGRSPGGFLRSLLENDLSMAVSRSRYDMSSRACLYDICLYVYNCAPAPSWGSPAKVVEWISRKEAEQREAVELAELKK